MEKHSGTVWCAACPLLFEPQPDGTVDREGPRFLPFRLPAYELDLSGLEIDLVPLELAKFSLARPDVVCADE
jgi:hypothetical protein